jgi:starch phosphorylase
MHGPVGPSNELAATDVVEMTLVGLAESPGLYRYAGSFVCEQAGRYGFTVRVVPNHPDLMSPAELGCISWA